MVKARMRVRARVGVRVRVSVVDIRFGLEFGCGLGV
jgi:hypothetical protein